MKIKKKKYKKQLNKEYERGYKDAIMYALQHPEIVNAKRTLYNLGQSLSRVFGEDE